MTKVCGIYLITHVASGRQYVGQSIDIVARLRSHASGRSGDGFLRNAIEKYGWQAFETKVLHECRRDQLNQQEQLWIEALGTLHPNGFNLTTGGAQAFKFSEAARLAISAGTKRGLTPEVIARRAQSLRGVPKSAAHKQAISSAARNHENLERLRSLASNQSPDTRERIAASKRGKPLSPQHRAKISETRRARGLGGVPGPRSEEAKARMSTAAKSRAGRSKQGTTS